MLSEILNTIPSTIPEKKCGMISIIPSMLIPPLKCAMENKALDIIIASQSENHLEKLVIINLR